MKRGLMLSLAFFCLAQFAFAQSPKELTIESIYTGTGITGRGPETIKWSPDGSKVTFVQRDATGEHGALYYVDVTTGKKAVLVTEEKLSTLAPPISKIKDEREKERIQRYSVAGYQWAPDSKHLLFDSRGQLWYYSLDTGTAVQITSSTDPTSDPKFSRDGKRIAYLRKHNLYVHYISDAEERQLTKDTEDTILNGEVDWVYAEELDVRSNYFWSPEGKQIVFLQMNEKQVPTYPITDWVPSHPNVDQEKYPKAGDPNPEVRIGVIGSSGGNVKWFTLGEPADREYIPRFGWVREGVLWVQLLNRAQDKLDLYFVETSSGKSRRVLSETEPDAWVPVTDNFKILKSGDKFLWSSWRDGHEHLYLYRFDKANPLDADAKVERQLTHGDFEVSSVLGVDETSGTVYFAANANDPRQQHVFKVPLTGGEMKRVSHEEGTHNATMPDTAKYYVDNFSAILTPPRLSFCKVDGSCQSFWESNSVAQHSLIAPKFVEYKAADGVTTLYGLLLMPPAGSVNGKIPVILNPYGGPSGQVAKNAWGGANFLFHQIMARRGFAILQVDNRGMAARGKKFGSATRRNFGEVELADQLAALQQALAADGSLDPNRLGWWGWSYGGYMTTYAMTHSNKFKAGVSVAPVTDWRDYDSIYTERYMGLPKDNAEGYKKSSPVNNAKELSGRLLLVHGTSDDNVHMQNTVQMVESLVNAGKAYDLQLYPRKTHGIAGRAARVHLFHRIQSHFEETLMPASQVPTQ